MENDKVLPKYIPAKSVIKEGFAARRETRKAKKGSK
jgi:hypothetical protein